MRTLRFVLYMILLFALNTKVDAQEGDSPETLDWVIRTARLIEERLTTAINVTDEPTLLIKLMESSSDFESVAFIGLYCHEARTAAEMGRMYCNWLNTYTQDKDLNTLIRRAQEARQQAVNMRDAAASCNQTVKQFPPEKSFSLSDIIRGNAETINLDLADGLASQNLHILSQKIEHAERLFHDTEVLTARLSQCEAVTMAAQEGIRLCMAALAAPNWTEIKVLLQKASGLAEDMKVRGVECH